jgi:hypothetical protein
MPVEHDRNPRRDEASPAPGATIGNRGEPSAETVPDVQPDDERMSANDAQSSGEGKSERRVEGRDDEWPAGHRSGDMPPRRGVEQPR